MWWFARPVLRYAKFCGRSNVTSPIPHRLHDPRCSMYGTGYIIYLQYKSVYYSIMIPNVHPMIPDVRIVYLPTKLGDFGQGQMLGFIFQHHASQMGMFFSLIVWEGIQCFSYRICSGLERFEQASVFLVESPVHYALDPRRFPDPWGSVVTMAATWWFGPKDTTSTATASSSSLGHPVG